MTGPERIPSGATVVIDSSVLFAMGGPENEKHRTFRRFVERNGITVTVSERVAEELGESPSEYGYQLDRLRMARESGWLRPVRADFTIRGVPGSSIAPASAWRRSRPRTSLKTRSRRPTQSSQAWPTSRRSEVPIGDVLGETEFGERISVVEGREFLSSLLGEEW